jgi:ornithine cyclodeaminase/alanine dehydrogenase-like protein (mu-crystallin family)
VCITARRVLVRARGSVMFVDRIEAMREATENGVFSSDNLKGSLLGLCKREIPGRSSSEEITMFKAVGSALADLAAASMVYKACTVETFPQ